jgi:3-methylcrotonyl-CoA carboxylase alpha subunit
MKLHLQGGDTKIVADVRREGDRVLVSIGENSTEFTIVSAESSRYLLANNGKLQRCNAVRQKDDLFLHLAGRTYRIAEMAEDVAIKGDGGTNDLNVVAPMPGTVIKVLVQEGETVSRRQPLVIVEAMKMENEVRAPGDAVVGKVLVAAGEKVGFGQHLIELVPPEPIVGATPAH